MLNKNTNLRKTAHEVRAVFADMSKVSIEKARPNADSTVAARLAYGGLSLVNRVGQLASYKYVRKTPDWPFRLKSEPSVIGWGQEKIAYKILPEGSQAGDLVVSVYHWESVINNPWEVIQKKKRNYEQYRKYFGDSIVPTQFMVLDNPWGDGGKPASIQPYIDLEHAESLRDYTPDLLRVRAAEDQTFAKGMHSLKEGYDRMTEEGLCPDFGGGNVVIDGSNVRIFDTGIIESADKVAKLKAQYPIYSLIESFNDPLVAQ